MQTSPEIYNLKDLVGFFPQAIIEKRNTEGHIFFEDILFTYLQCNIFKLDTQKFYIVIYKI